MIGWLAGSCEVSGIPYVHRSFALCWIWQSPIVHNGLTSIWVQGIVLAFGIVYVKGQLWSCYSIVGYYYKALWNAFFWLVSCSGHTLILNDCCPEYGNIVHIIVAKTPLLCFRVLITLLGFILCCIFLYICYCMVTLQHHSLFEVLALKHVSIVPDVTIFL